LSLRAAAKATFALNAGLNTRRFLDFVELLIGLEFYRFYTLSHCPVFGVHLSEPTPDNRILKFLAVGNW
jgi:hypothetical protein